MNDNFHRESIWTASKIFAAPCSCGPAVHINLQDAMGQVFATAVITPAVCDELIKQIRASKRALKTAQGTGS